MKIVMYADSTGCTGCKLQLDMWKFYIDDVRKVINGRVLFLFYLQPRSIKELKYLLESEEFDYPIKNISTFNWWKMVLAQMQGMMMAKPRGCI